MDDKLSKGKVLVVDDAPFVRAVVSRHLRKAGFGVDEEHNGAAAMRRLQAGEYDVVITDLGMPELDGLGVLSEVKSRALGAEVIILTGTHARDMDAAVRALRLGAHDYLAKPPSNADEVILTVERAVEKKRLRDANLRLMRELQALSRTDPLTSLLNRRAFDESLRREHHRAQRYGFPMAVALLDLDGFKRINDTHGHQGGDEVLRSFACLAVSVFRDSDAVYRFGGDEFAALLPHTDPEGALDAVRRLVTKAAETRVALKSSHVTVTCSAGVACLDTPDLAASELLARADAALYDAKKAGRNRALTWGGRTFASPGCEQGALLG